MKIFFYDNDSFLNRLNPLSKVVTSLPFIFLICLINEIWIPLAFIVFTAFIVLVLGRIPLIRFLKILAPISIFFISIFILFLLASRSDLTVGSPILFSIGEFHFYEYSVRLGLIYAIRIFALLILILPFSLTTEPSTFIRSLIQNLNIPYKFSYGVMVAFRFIPMIETEFNVVRSAHKVMGFSDDKGIFSYINKIKRYSIPLIVNSIRLGGRTALSMDSRAFGAFENRTYFKTLTFNRNDWIYIFAYWIIGLLIFIVAYKFGLMGKIGFYIGEFR